MWNPCGPNGRIHRSDQEEPRHARSALIGPGSSSSTCRGCDRNCRIAASSGTTSIGSTMTEASRLAGAGAPSGTVVGAEEQTAGQGRHGRSWHSEPGSGPLRLHHSAAPIHAGDVARGHARARLSRCAKRSSSTADLACDLRWPNDVLIESKKCAGILTAARILGYHCRHRHQRESFVVPSRTERHRYLAAHRQRPRSFARAAAGGPARESSTAIAICSKPRAADQSLKRSRAHPATFPAAACAWIKTGPCCVAPPPA